MPLSSVTDEATVYANYINRDKNSFDSYFIPKPMFKLVADIVGEDMVEKIVKARKDKLDALQDSKSNQSFSRPSTRPSTPTPRSERGNTLTEVPISPQMKMRKWKMKLRTRSMIMVLILKMCLDKVHILSIMW